jgi:acyl-CoA thioester hydrolase
MKSLSGEYRVIYADVDPMGVVYYANYLKMLEIGRTEFFRQLDLPYSRVEKHGVLIPVSEMQCKFLKPARYDDVIVIETAIRKLTRASITFEYRLYRKSNGEDLLTGMTKHAFMGFDGKIMRVPAFMAKKIESMVAEGGEVQTS